MGSAYYAWKEGIRHVRSIRERLNAMQPEAPPSRDQRGAGVPVERVLAGLDKSTDRGSHFVVETTVTDPTETRHSWGNVLRSLAGGAGDAEDMLFLDTETTGLDRGTGTHVFLVGLGYFTSAGFVVQQHFLRDLHEEASLLCDIDELIREYSILVTFNGRGFDWPMINTRFILHGYRDVPELAHWDLLTSSRRIWRNRLRDCSLGSLERQILGVERFGDVPGYLIPDLYFDYLRTRDARPLRPVFSHNHEDIVSLARLAERLVWTEQNPLHSLDHPVDQISYGLFLLNQGHLQRAKELIRPNLQFELLEDDIRFRAFSLLASNYKRRGKWTEAVELWSMMLNHRWQSLERALHPLVELAKVYEHKFRDFRVATSYVERAINLFDLHSHRRDDSRAALIHRYARLRRRLKNE